MLAQVHLDEIKACLSSSPILQTVSVSVEHSGQNHGYFRAKATLINGDFLEVAEYFTVVDDLVQVQRYRHQWMEQSQGILKKRWDNSRHFPDLPNFPHHIHLGSETQVFPGQSLGILELIEVLEQEVLVRGLTAAY